MLLISCKKAGYRFKNNPIYEIYILKSDTTSYYLKEKLYSKGERPNEKNFIYMEMENAQGVISTREKGKIGIQKYPQESKQVNFKSTELILRQISDPDRFYPLFTLKRTIEEFSAYYYFDTTSHSLIRQSASYGTETKLLSDGGNLRGYP